MQIGEVDERFLKHLTEEWKEISGIARQKPATPVDVMQTVIPEEPVDEIVPEPANQDFDTEVFGVQEQQSRMTSQRSGKLVKKRTTRKRIETFKPPADLQHDESLADFRAPAMVIEDEPT